MFWKITIGVGIIFGLLITAIVAFLAYRYHGNRNIEDTKNLEQIVEKAGNQYVGETGNVGLVIGVVKADRTYIKGFGRTHTDGGSVPNGETLFELASIGKTFTTSVAQILANRGALSLDETLDQTLGAKTKLCDKLQKTTLRQLAAHTSGLPSFPESFASKIKDEKNPYKDLIVQDLYDYLASCEDFGASESYEYSNVGMGVLGHVLELKTGKSYENLVKTELTEPLEMRNTTINLTEEQRKILAQGYDEQGEPTPVWEDSVLTGAGSFLSNAEDMIKFIRANVGENQSPLAKSLVKTHEPQFGDETGLGWHRYSKFFAFITDEKDVVWHNGAAGGYASFIALNKKAGSGVIVFSNSTNDVTALGTRLNFMARNVSLAGD